MCSSVTAVAGDIPGEESDDDGIRLTGRYYKMVFHGKSNVASLWHLRRYRRIGLIHRSSICKNQLSVNALQVKSASS